MNANQILTLQSHSDGSNRIHLAFDPRSNAVALLGELATQHLVVLLLAQFVGQRLVTLRHQSTDVRPFACQIVGAQRCVRILQTTGNLVLADDALDFADEAHDDVVLLVGLAERRLELIVRLHQALDLFHRVHDEHVDEILASAVQPVVERSGALGELEMKDVDLLEDALGVVELLATTLRESAEAVPLVADALATRVDRGAVVVLQGAGMEGNNNTGRVLLSALIKTHFNSWAMAAICSTRSW